MTMQTELLKRGILAAAMLSLAACGDTGGTGDGGTTDGGLLDAGTDAGTVTDAGVDAGTPCTFGTCDTGVCNLATSKCESPTCSTAAEEPSSCAYGEYCAGDSLCYEAPWAALTASSCSNFPTTAWQPTTDTGPVIYFVEKTTADTTWCAGSTPADVSVLLHAYNSASTFAATGATFPSNTLFYVRADGTYCDVTSCNGAAMFRPVSGYTVATDRKDVTFKLNFCGVTGATLNAGFYFTGGNEYCAPITK
jgi:hypothetical protein